MATELTQQIGEALLDAVLRELDARGVAFAANEVAAFIRAAQPCDDTAEDFVAGWEEAVAAFPAAFARRHLRPKEIER
jgi:hypothetical protein